MIKRLKALGIILYLSVLMVTLVPVCCLWAILESGYKDVRDEFKYTLWPHWSNTFKLCWRVLTRTSQKESTQ